MRTPRPRTPILNPTPLTPSPPNKTRQLPPRCGRPPLPYLSTIGSLHNLNLPLQLGKAPTALPTPAIQPLPPPRLTIFEMSTNRHPRSVKRKVRTLPSHHPHLNCPRWLLPMTLVLYLIVTPVTDHTRGPAQKNADKAVLQPTPVQLESILLKSTPEIITHRIPIQALAQNTSNMQIRARRRCKYPLSSVHPIPPRRRPLAVLILARVMSRLLLAVHETPQEIETRPSYMNQILLLLLRDPEPPQTSAAVEIALSTTLHQTHSPLMRPTARFLMVTFFAIRIYLPYNYQAAL